MDEAQPDVKSCKDRLRLLVNNEFFSDMKVLVGPTKTPVYVNKAILGIASPYFEKLFFGPLATKSSHTNLPDTEPEVFELFLDYIYTGNLDEKLDDDLVWKLIELGKMCLVPHLEETCRQKIIRNFNANNVLGCLAQSECSEDWEVGNAAERFIDRFVVEILDTQEFLNLDLDLLCKLFGRDTLEIGESVLYDSLLRWSEAECGRQGIQPTTENKRRVLGRSLELIRVSLMTDEEIAASLVDEIFPDSGPPPSKSPKRSIVREFAPEKYHVRRFARIEDVSVDCDIKRGISDDDLEEPVAESHVDLTIGIVSDKQIFLHGVGVFSNFKDLLHHNLWSQRYVYGELKVKVFDVSKNSLESWWEARCTNENPRDEFMSNFMFSRGPLLIRPGVKYNICLEGKICVYGDDEGLTDYEIYADGKKGVSPLSEVTVGHGYKGIHATVKIESPQFPTQMTDADAFSLGNIPELIFSF